MRYFATPARQILINSAVVGILGVLGCSDDGLGKRYPVSGTVTYKGEPLKEGSIVFAPTAPNGRGATGTIVDGAYSLTTQEPGDGAFPGSYKVTINDKKVDEAKVSADSEKLAAKAGVKATMPDPAVIARQRKVAKSGIPVKYLSQDASGLTAEVKAESNSFDFPLVD